MQTNQIAQEFYSTELFEQLKKAYDRRVEELGELFALAVTKLEESSVLEEMKGQDLMEYRIQHIQEISRQVIVNHQQMHIQQYLRTISQLKAQLAIERKKLELVGKNPQELDNNRRTQYLQEQMKSLKKQLSGSDSNDTNPENTQLSEKKRKNNTKHKLPHSNSELQQGRQSGNKLLLEKYEQVLSLERKRSQQNLKEQRQKNQIEVNNLRAENQRLKAENEKLNAQSRYRMQKAQQLANTVNNALNQPVVQVLHTTKQSGGAECIQQLEHFKSRTKKQTPYAYLLASEMAENIKTQTLHRTSKQSLSYLEAQVLKSGCSTGAIEKGALNSRSFALHESSSSGFPRANTKFQQIQNSFAKELEELRTKMLDNRQKLQSPKGIKPRGIGRDSSLRRKIPQPPKSPKYFSPHKYGFKNYNHY